MAGVPTGTVFAGNDGRAACAPWLKYHMLHARPPPSKDSSDPSALAHLTARELQVRQT
jgi:hypothetical protein